LFYPPLKEPFVDAEENTTFYALGGYRSPAAGEKPATGNRP